MTRFLTSDLHFGHVNISKLAGRPYTSVDDMNIDLICRWNSLVQPSDEVWILGDLCMGRLDDSLALVPELNGTKVLIPGNHDRMFAPRTPERGRKATQRYLDAGISMVTVPRQLHLCPEVTAWADHFPYAGDSHSTDRYAEYRPADRGGFLVHGHAHGKWLKNGRMIDVGVDAWGGYPVPFDLVGETLRSGVEWIDAQPW